nr:MAG TPA: YvrJ protein family protein [Caudoviricetes sp.]
MDTNMIVQLISSLGFPIACCIAMFWQNNKLNENHKEETNKLNEAINNNTIALNHLIDKIGGNGNDT